MTGQRGDLPQPAGQSWMMFQFLLSRHQDCRKGMDQPWCLATEEDTGWALALPALRWHSGGQWLPHNTLNTADAWVMSRRTLMGGESG